MQHHIGNKAQNTGPGIIPTPWPLGQFTKLVILGDVCKTVFFMQPRHVFLQFFKRGFSIELQKNQHYNDCRFER